MLLEDARRNVKTDHGATGRHFAGLRRLPSSLKISVPSRPRSTMIVSALAGSEMAMGRT